MSDLPEDCLDADLEVLARAHPWERDARIAFDPGPHAYLIDGARAKISVTGVVERAAGSFDAEAKIREWEERGRFPPKYKGMTGEEILESWRVNGADKAQKGNVMHAAFEVFMNTGYASQIPQLEREMLYFKAFWKKEVEERGLIPWRAEPRVFTDPEHISLAGSVDALFWDPESELYVLMDWKRSQEIPCTAKGRFGYFKHPAFRRFEKVKMNKYSLQLNIYRYILEKYYGLKFRDDMWVVQVNPHKISYVMHCAVDMREETEELMRELYEERQQELHGDTEGMDEFTEEEWSGIDEMMNQV